MDKAKIGKAGRIFVFYEAFQARFGLESWNKINGGEREEALHRSKLGK